MAPIDMQLALPAMGMQSHKYYCKRTSANIRIQEDNRMIDIKPVTLAVRFFDDHASYGDRYRAVATVQITPDVAYVSSLHGDITREDYDKLLEAMKDYGVAEVQWHRMRSKTDEVQSKLVRRPIQASYDGVLATGEIAEDCRDGNNVVPIGRRAKTAPRF